MNVPKIDFASETTNKNIAESVLKDYIFSQTLEMTLVNVENHFGGARTVISFFFVAK